MEKIFFEQLKKKILFARNIHDTIFVINDRLIFFKIRLVDFCYI